MFGKIELWCIFYCIVVVAAQELAGFHKNHTVDFDRDQVLADIMPATQHVKPSEDPVTDFRNDDVDVVEGMHTDTRSNRIMRKSTTAGQDEDAGRLAPVISLEDATMTNSTQTTTSMEASVKDMTPTQGSGLASTSPPRISSSVTEMPPHIRWPNSPLRMIVMELNRKNYRVNCVADGHPEIVYEWLRDDQPLNDADPHIKAYPNGSLVFPEFSDREDGMFQCRATNQYGTSVSVKLPIINEKPPKKFPDNAKVNKSYEAYEGQPVNLTCAETPPTVPEYQKRWFLKESTQVKMTGTIGTDAQGVLRFAYVSTEDANSYICGLAPDVAAAGDSIRLYNSATLKVHARQKYPTAPELQYISKNVKAVVGGKAILECFYSGYPIPKIEWMHDNQMLNEADTRYSITFGRRLTIKEVMETDRGTYTCTASNGYGKPKDTVSLNVTGPPQKSANEGLYNVVKPEGENVVLKCKAQAIGGQRLEAPIWFRNGQPFNESSPAFSSRYVFSDSGRELHISNLNKESDTACFQCNISNSEGYLFYDGFLKVINAFEITKRPESHIVLTGREETFDISVQAKGDTCCDVEYRWHFNGIILLEEEFQKPPFVKRDNGDLLFNPSSVSNEVLMSRLGNYTCRIFDNYQEVVVSFVMTDNKPLELTNVEAGGVHLWWVGLLCGILLILIAVIIIVAIVKSNFPRNSYPLEKAEIKHHLNPEQDLLDQSFQEI
ncbi:hypothetical protein BsWGS_24152 [Bradybaena similaris]